jgi:hypothetical protein
MAKKVDLIERFEQHVKYSLERDKWARRAIDLLAKGKDKAGMAAAKKAMRWERKAKALLP